MGEKAAAAREKIRLFSFLLSLSTPTTSTALKTRLPPPTPLENAPPHF
jgi:hypothetical protein